MRRLSRFWGTCAAAALLLVSMIPGAQADYPPEKDQAIVACPTNAQVEAVLGGTTKHSIRAAHRCAYERAGGQVVYEFLRDTLSNLADLRSFAETTPDFVDFPTVGGFGYEQTPGSIEVFFASRDEVMHLHLPSAKKGNGVALAELFKKATQPWAGITIAPTPMTPTCPSAQAVSRVTKKTYTSISEGKKDCEYVRGDDAHLTYDIDEFFGAVAETRVGTEMRLKGGEALWTLDFAGLGAGAYYTSMSGFTNLKWQQSSGVVVELLSQEDLDTNRRLATLFNSVQIKDKNGKPSPSMSPKPGLPSTGN